MRKKSSAQIVAEKLLGEKKAHRVHTAICGGEVACISIADKNISINPRTDSFIGVVGIIGISGLSVVHTRQPLHPNDVKSLSEFMWQVLVLISIENPLDSKWIAERYRDSCVVI